MDIRFCHPSDFSEFLKLKNSQTCEFGGVFGPLINSVISPFLRKFNLTGVVHSGYGLGEPTDDHGSYSGCLGRLQRNESDLLLRLADYPSTGVNISQGEIFLDTKLVLSQTYLQKGADTKFQILSTIRSLDAVAPYILLFFIAVLIILRSAGALHKRPRVYTFRPFVPFVYINNCNALNTFAHAFRFGSLRVNQLHSRLIFLSLSVFSLIVIHIFYSSIKTDLVVVTEPDHWDSYDDIMRDNIRPVFIEEMDTIQYFKLARAGSVEHKLWRYTEKMFGEKKVLIRANIQSFFQTGMEMQQRSSLVILDHLMAIVVRNAVCGLNRYDYAGLAKSASPTPFDWHKTILYHLTSDPLAGTIQKGVVFNGHWESKAAEKTKRFIKRTHENGIVQAIVNYVTTANMMESFVSDLPRSANDASTVTECKSDTILKSKGKRDKLVTFGNTVSLRICYLILNGIAMLVLLTERILPKKRRKRRKYRRWVH